MKQARCNKDLFWAPESGEIICAGIIQNYLDLKELRIRIICYQEFYNMSVKSLFSE